MSLTPDYKVAGITFAKLGNLVLITNLRLLTWGHALIVNAAGKGHVYSVYKEKKLS